MNSLRREGQKNVLVYKAAATWAKLPLFTGLFMLCSIILLVFLIFVQSIALIFIYASKM
jgi:hypothetical protein